MNSLPLWMVVTIFNQVVATHGPLPMDVTQCETLRLVKMQFIDKTFQSNVDIPKIDGDDRKIELKDIRLYCYSANVRPPLGSTFQ